MSLLHDKSARHLRIVSMLACIAKPGAEAAAVVSGLEEQYDRTSSLDSRNFVAFKRRALQGDGRMQAGGGAPSEHVLVLGDDWEWQAGFDGQPMANATAIAYRLEEGLLEAFSAIPGLPPLYVAETTSHIVVTSDPFLLKCVDGLQLRFAPDSIMDLARIGRPVGHRTMFEGVRLMPGGTRLAVSIREGLTEGSAWEPPESDPCSGWVEYTALQADAFGNAAKSLDYQDAVLSLTAGLDTRAILAGLIANDITIPALTVTGETLCLDARTASGLCAAYGMTHRAIALDDGFCRSLADLADRASLLSGGIGSVGHAGQVYCYSLLGTPSPDKMLSGYLGNQIGRLGTEGLTPRGAGTHLLLRELTSAAETRGPPESWYAEAMQPDGHLEPRFLIQQESMYGNLASYSIGNTFSVQQSTYGSRELIENLWRMPAVSGQDGHSARFHDLKHRFFGEPLSESFQRRYINRVGGMVADYPVNWGWRCKGGVSLTGLLWGGLALVDAVVSSRFSQTPVMGLIRGLGIAGLHEYRPVHHWMHRHLREFVNDTLLSRETAEAGLFDTALLASRLDAYYSGGSEGYGDILLALDLALAAKNFNATA